MESVLGSKTKSFQLSFIQCKLLEKKSLQLYPFKDDKIIQSVEKNKSDFGMWATGEKNFIIIIK